jgi:hypothetical protein
MMALYDVTVSRCFLCEELVGLGDSNPDYIRRDLDLSKARLLLCNLRLHYVPPATSPLALYHEPEDPTRDAGLLFR